MPGASGTATVARPPGRDANEEIQPYLPRLLLRWAAESPGQDVLELDASVAFVDISGFTRLSERLARSGKVGAEELAEAINTCFTRLLAVAYGNGGGLIKFGGDALLLLFSGVDHRSKACRAAAGMRRALKEIGSLQTPGGRIALRMSVGVHSGLFQFFLVGESHRELIVTGPAATQTVMMESTAEAGEIVVSAGTAAGLPDGALKEKKGEGWLLRREPPGFTPEPTQPETDCSNIDLFGYVPVAIRDHLRAGINEPEHRRVTVAFVHFDGTDAMIREKGSSDAASALHELVVDIQEATQRYGVCFLGSDLDKDGGKIILAAGAPDASGNDEERMLLALNDIVRKERRISVRVGVNTGYVFAGDIGPAYRRTYTVMGDAVNLAARVMAKATAGQCLATEAVLGGSRTTFHTTALEPFFVKGKSKAVTAFAVGDVIRTKETDQSNRSVPLIGRDEEMKVLRATLASSRDHRGGLVEIIAEPGMGKSRLVEELRAEAIEETILHLSCELYESSTPYYPFRSLLRSVLGIREDATEQAAEARLNEVLAAVAPHLIPLAPLVGIAMDLELPETDQTRDLEERFRRPRLNEAVQELLARLLRTPTLFTIEDAHWMDEPSADLLRYLASRSAQLPWMICVTRRDVSDGFTASGENSLTIRLEPLDASTAAELVAISTEDSPFPPHQVAALAERSGGNPLFLRELLAAARTEGLETLPDSVEALIMARIDRLPPSDRNLLRRASVLGQTFERSLLDSVMDPVPSSDDGAWHRLRDFIQADNGTMRFVHALIRDGAYEGLPYRLRRQLHSQVGETIERASRAMTPDERAELLSMHFFYAQRYMEAWRYSLAAAERAKGSYAYVEAAEFYERALAAARRIPDFERLETARITEALGDVRDRTGAYVDAEKAYRIVRRIVKGDPIAEARLQLKISSVEGWLRRSQTRTVGAITKGLRILRGLTEVDAVAQRAHLMVAYAQFCLDSGRFADAVKWCNRAIREADTGGVKQALADAYRLLDWASVELGRVDLATNSRKALALYEEIGDLRGQAWVLNNLGGFAYWQGRWDDALPLYRRAFDIQKKIGDEVAASSAAVNIAEILSARGQVGDAETMLQGALRVFRAEGVRRWVGLAKSILGFAYSRVGRLDEALALLHEARDELTDAAVTDFALECDARIAECLVLQGDPATALSLTEAALEKTSSIGGVSALSPVLNRVRGYALIKLGRLDEARDALDESLVASRARKAEHEIALTLHALHRLASIRREPFLESTRIQSEEIIKRLGLVVVDDISALAAAPSTN